MLLSRRWWMRPCSLPPVCPSTSVPLRSTHVSLQNLPQHLSRQSTMTQVLPHRASCQSIWPSLQPTCPTFSTCSRRKQWACGRLTRAARSQPHLENNRRAVLHACCRSCRRRRRRATCLRGWKTPRACIAAWFRRGLRLRVRSTGCRSLRPPAGDLSHWRSRRSCKLHRRCRVEMARQRFLNSCKGRLSTAQSS